MASYKYIVVSVLLAVVLVVVIQTGHYISTIRPADFREYLPQLADVVEAKEVRRREHVKSSDFLGTGYFPLRLTSLSLAEAQKLFHGYFENTTYTCQKIKRFGNKGDGGYDVCMDEVMAPKRNNCLVYSFGIRNEWSFDEAINSYFGCDVYSFDPSIRLPNHTHREPNMYFYNLGIWGSNWRNKQKWELRDLATIVKSLKHENRIIDYLKVDVEGAEWPLITHIIKSDVHKQIKQIALELHTPRRKGDSQSMTVIDYAEIYYGLVEMERLGFRRFRHYTNNNCCTAFAKLTPKSIAKKQLCCYETFFVNIKWSEFNKKQRS